MTDDISHHSSIMKDASEDDYDGWSAYDGSCAASDESEISATRLATDIEYGVIWELLHAWQEAAFSDIPLRYCDCLSVFDTNRVDSGLEPMTFQEMDTEDYRGLFRVAGATNPCPEPWSLPAVTRPLSEADARWPPNLRVLNVSRVTPTAAIYLTPDRALDKLAKHLAQVSGAEEATTSTKNQGNAAESSLTPLAHATTPLFASTVFTCASQVSGDGRLPSFHALWRYNRLATTALLRQAHSLQIDTLIFGVLLQRNLVAIHIDWYEERDGVVESNSTFFTPHDEEADTKTWDLRQPSEAREVAIILSNLRKYTSGEYASRVRRGLETITNQVKPWKWNKARLPDTLTYTELQRHPPEPTEEKVARWQEGTAVAVNTAGSHESPETWLRKKWYDEKLERRGVRLPRDFLSPPSTPQSPGEPLNGK